MAQDGLIQLQVAGFSSGREPAPHNINPNGINLAKREAQVLIIDDELEIAEEVAESLEMKGFTCSIATSAKSGLTIFYDTPSISIVITDVRMPDVGGLELCRSIQKEKKPERDVAILIMTGHAGLDASIEALKLGALDFLTKPLSPSLLLHAVRRADQHIHACTLERKFKETLLTEVALKTRELQEMAIALKKNNTKLTAANKIKDEFLSMISHELFTPLHQIIGFADILKMEIGDPHQRECLAQLDKASWRLTDMLNSIVSVIAVETGTLNLNLSQVQIPQVIEKTTSAYQPRARKSGVTIVANDVSDSLVRIDQLRTSQALGCLIDNAIKFSPAGASVRVSARLSRGILSISVQDSGSGMSAEDQEHALQTFTQVDGSSTRTCEGTGTGLPLARMFAELHGGSLTIQSIPGQGSTVTLEIPIE
jgi:signal transduction histidine kinase